MRALLVVTFLTGCSKIFGFNDPQLRDAAVDDASIDGSVGIDAPGAVGAFGIQTTNNGPVSLVGGFALQVTCDATGTVCAIGGF